MTWVVYENEPFEASREEQSFLRGLLGDHLETNGSFVRIVRRAGHLRLPDGRTLIIRSGKAGGAGMLAWLAYGDPSLRSLRFLTSLPSTGSEADFGGLVARMFCIETWHAIESSGLLRAYHRQHIRTAVVRGRIDFAAMARTGGDIARTPCIAFARLPQTPLNCLLSAALTLIARDPELRAAAGTTLAPLAALLAEVPPRVDRDLLTGKSSLSRIEHAFEASVALARIVIRGVGLSGGTTLAGPCFLVDLARLFEDSVVRAFRDYGLECEAKRLVHIHRQSADGIALERHLPMELDLFLPSVRGERVVVDAKYKRQVSAANLHQMATYCWLTGARRAVLILPRGNVADRRSFVLRAGDDSGSVIRVDVAELDLSSGTLEGWHRAARELVGQVSGSSLV